MVTSFTIASNSPVKDTFWPDFSYNRSCILLRSDSLENLTFKCTRFHLAVRHSYFRELWIFVFVKFVDQLDSCPSP